MKRILPYICVTSAIMLLGIPDAAGVTISVPHAIIAAVVLIGICAASGIASQWLNRENEKTHRRPASAPNHINIALSVAHSEGECKNVESCKHF